MSLLAEIIPHLAALTGTTLKISSTSTAPSHHFICKNLQQMHIQQERTFKLTIQGNNNVIRLGNGCEISQLRVTGTGNHIILEDNVIICDYSFIGTGNSIEAYQTSNLCQEQMNDDNILITRIH